MSKKKQNKKKAIERLKKAATDGVGEVKKDFDTRFPKQEESDKKKAKRERYRNSWRHKIFGLDTRHGKVISFGLVSVSMLFAGYGLANFTLSGNAIGGTVATYSGGYILANNLYNNLKNNTDGSSMVRTTLLMETFGNLYGEKISDAEVEEALPNYRTSGISTLNNAGESESDLKKLVRQQLALQYGLKQNLSVTDEEIAATWKTFHPDVKIKVISTTNESDYEAIKSGLNSGTAFTELAKKYDQMKLDGADVNISSDNSLFTTEQLNQIYALKDGQTGTIGVQSYDSVGNIVTTYYVVKMVENQDKGSDMSKWKDAIVDQVKSKKVQVGLGQVSGDTQDETTANVKAVTEAIKKVFKKEKVVVTDTYMRQALSDYLN